MIDIGGDVMGKIAVFHVKYGKKLLYIGTIFNILSIVSGFWALSTDNFEHWTLRFVIISIIYWALHFIFDPCPKGKMDETSFEYLNRMREYREKIEEFESMRKPILNNLKTDYAVIILIRIIIGSCFLLNLALMMALGMQGAVNIRDMFPLDALDIN